MELSARWGPKSALR